MGGGMGGISVSLGVWGAHKGLEDTPQLQGESLPTILEGFPGLRGRPDSKTGSVSMLARSWLPQF